MNQTKKFSNDIRRSGSQSIGRGPVENIPPGHVVRIPPGEKRWHGATSTMAMAHIAIQELMDGRAVDFMGRLSDERYQSGSVAVYAQTSAGFVPVRRIEERFGYENFIKTIRNIRLLN